MKTITLTPEELRFLKDTLKSCMEAYVVGQQSLELGSKMLNEVRAMVFIHSDPSKAQKMIDDCDMERDKAEREQERRYSAIVSLQAKLMVSATDN